MNKHPDLKCQSYSTVYEEARRAEANLQLLVDKVMAYELTLTAAMKGDRSAPDLGVISQHMFELARSLKQ